MADMSLCVHRQNLELVIRGDVLRLTDTPKKEKRSTLSCQGVLRDPAVGASGYVPEYSA
jgi:hypothetical protein